MMDTKTVLLVGVGGQGTILAGDILAKTAAAEGLDVKISEIHGMSQRGGSVSTVVRFGDAVSSMVVDPGTADVIVSFELVEALRAQQFLKQGGTMFVNRPTSTATTMIAAWPVNTNWITPATVQSTMVPTSTSGWFLTFVSTTPMMSEPTMPVTVVMDDTEFAAAMSMPTSGVCR